jgi:hypothetical protein
VAGIDQLLRWHVIASMLDMKARRQQPPGERRCKAAGPAGACAK